MRVLLVGWLLWTIYMTGILTGIIRFPNWLESLDDNVLSPLMGNDPTLWILVLFGLIPGVPLVVGCALYRTSRWLIHGFRGNKPDED